MSFSERLEDTVGVMTIVVVVTNGWGNKLAFFFPSLHSLFTLFPLLLPFLFFSHQARCSALWIRECWAEAPMFDMQNR